VSITPDVFLRQPAQARHPNEVMRLWRIKNKQTGRTLFHETQMPDL
jgi:hypothetical protein